MSLCGQREGLTSLRSHSLVHEVNHNLPNLGPQRKSKAYSDGCSCPELRSGTIYNYLYVFIAFPRESPSQVVYTYQTTSLVPRLTRAN